VKQLYAGQQAVQHQIQQLIGQSKAHLINQPAPSNPAAAQAPIPQTTTLMNAPQVTPHQMTQWGHNVYLQLKSDHSALLHTGRSLACTFQTSDMLLLVILKHNFDPVYCRLPALVDMGNIYTFGCSDRVA